MIAVKNYKFWFCTGSQDLYGDECLAHVAEHSGIIVDSLNESGILPYEVVQASSPGCIHFHRPSPGFWDCRNTESP